MTQPTGQLSKTSETTTSATRVTTALEEPQLQLSMSAPREPINPTSVPNLSTNASQLLQATISTSQVKMLLIRPNNALVDTTASTVHSHRPQQALTTWLELSLPIQPILEASVRQVSTVHRVHQSQLLAHQERCAQPLDSQHQTKTARQAITVCEAPQAINRTVLLATTARLEVTSLLRVQLELGPPIHASQQLRSAKIAGMDTIALTSLKRRSHLSDVYQVSHAQRFRDMRESTYVLRDGSAHRMELSKSPWTQ